MGIRGRGRSWVPRETEEGIQARKHDSDEQQRRLFLIGHFCTRSVYLKEEQAKRIEMEPGIKVRKNREKNISKLLGKHCA